MIIVDFYNGGRAAGMIEAMCGLAETGQLPLKYAIMMINIQHRNKDAWNIAKWRLLDNSGLYPPCAVKIELLD